MKEYAIQTFASLMGTMAFCVLFSVMPRHYLRCGLIGAAGWMVYLPVKEISGMPLLASFIATIVLTALSRFIAVKVKAPVTVFLVTGIFTLVPGAGIFYTAYYLFFGQPQMAAFHGFATFKTAIAIALGIGVVYSVPARAYGWKQDSQVWNEAEHRKS